MTPKLILATGIAWFLAVVAWLVLSPAFSFFVSGRLRSTLMLAYMLYMFFLTGWIVPIVVGIYGLVKSR